MFAKIKTAKRLQREMGGKVVFFVHDSDHDHRETCASLVNRHTGKTERLNFEVSNKIQKLYSPLYCKTIKSGWKDKTKRCLPNLVDRELVYAFASVETDNVADFCLDLYKRMGLLEGVELQRSSDPRFREAAIDIDDYFVDTAYKGEIVRARYRDGKYGLFKGGGRYIDVEVVEVTKKMISPTRDTRLKWMQSVIRCTHYVAGAGEIQYLNQSDAPEIEFVKRDYIENSGDAYAECRHDW
ncbi:MAG: hypothetical protein CMI15_14215 [Opitutaceae bacterium]|nr:hypothetical protein [Opitutaceae bacterium]